VIADRLPATDEPRDPGTRPFRVLATCGVFEPGFRGGGPVRSVAQIVDTLSEHVELALITRDRDLGASSPYPGMSGQWVNRGRTRVFYLDTGALRQWLRLLRELRGAPFDLLYVNSLWSPIFTVVPVVAVRLGLVRAGSVLIAPRGAFSPGALSLKARKKQLFLKWWGRLLKNMDVVWHASAEREAAEIRAACPWANVEISLNQVSLPREPLAPTSHDGAVRLVFIGRVAAKKNLALALEALRTLSVPVEFDIYGPLEDPVYWSRCQSLMDQLPTAVSVRYRGELTPSEVPRTFSGYDAFVFPTLGENFGHVIAESLSASCPVICSEETPWTEILEAGGGRVLRDLTADGIGKELQRLAALAPAERLRARQLAGNAYRSWRKDANGRNILDQTRIALRSVAR
jgi:glycosyltransferase involved in cell wall biosynthesis